MSSSAEGWERQEKAHTCGAHEIYVASAMYINGSNPVYIHELSPPSFKADCDAALPMTVRDVPIAALRRILS